uniref:Uncharacterized protein n=1 Tax=Anguilla anguilla TaxID=7936 RepID=A0A0E9VP15_ANGAN
MVSLLSSSFPSEHTNGQRTMWSLLTNPSGRRRGQS